jgi:hypothetical protein
MNAQIKPGRQDDAIALVRDGVKVMNAAGAQHVRMLLAGGAGEAFGSLVMVSELDSLTEYGAFVDRIGQDAAAQAYIARFTEPNGPIVPTSTHITADVPSDLPTRAERGSVIEVYYMKARPGGLERLISMGIRHRSLVEQHGAVSSHLLTSIHGGSQTGLLMGVAEFADNEAWGRATESLNGDPDFQRATAEFFAADSPADVVFSGLFSDVPLT